MIVGCILSEFFVCTVGRTNYTSRAQEYMYIQAHPWSQLYLRSALLTVTRSPRLHRLFCFWQLLFAFKARGIANLLTSPPYITPGPFVTSRAKTGRPNPTRQDRNTCIHSVGEKHRKDGGYAYSTCVNFNNSDIVLGLGSGFKLFKMDF